MSTSYISNQPIKLSDVVEITNHLKDFKIEIERKDDNWETITSSSVLENESVYRITYTSEPTEYEKYFFKRKDKLTTNHLFIFVDKTISECDFVRYGENDVSKIIEIIEYSTSTKLWDEHSYSEVSWLFQKDLEVIETTSEKIREELEIETTVN